MPMQNKTILHIANDYAGSKVYKNLVYELDQLDIQQIIYTAIRNKSKIGSNEINLQVKDSKTIYSSILNWHLDRVLYPLKIFKILRDIQSKIDLKQVKCIHAHTWYSDGGVAYFLSKKYDIPFIVTIRSTDLNIFQEKLAYLRPFGRKILTGAKQIILISASSERKVLKQSSLKRVINQIEEKIKIIPNGVDYYWIENSSFGLSRKISNIFNVLYVGRFTDGKQVSMLQEAIIQLNNELSQKIILHIVGGGGNDEGKVIELVKKHPDIFEFYGQINDKDKLLTVFRRCDMFAMPSRYETFGLVYVEAMLQGLPLLYSEGEGIDGFYSEKIGEKTKNHTVHGIKEKLRIMIDNFEQYSIPLEEVKKNHNWSLIAKEYEKIYQDCIESAAKNTYR